MTPDETASFERKTAALASVLGACFRTLEEASDAALEALLEGMDDEPGRVLMRAAWARLRLTIELEARNLVVPGYSLAAP